MDTHDLTIAIPDRKHEKLLHYLEHLASRTTTSTTPTTLPPHTPLQLPFEPNKALHHQFQCSSPIPLLAPPKPLAQVLGLLQHFQPALRAGRLLCWPLYAALTNTTWNPSARIPLLPAARYNLAILPTFLHHQQAKPIYPNLPTMTLDVDASKLASGGVLYTVHDVNYSQHYWTVQQDFHINDLELLSALLALQAFVDYIKGHTVHLRLDSQVAIAYIKHQGGKIPHLQQTAAELTAFCLLHQIDLIVSYIPTQHQTADHISR